MRHIFYKSARIGEIGCERIRRHLRETYRIETEPSDMPDQFRGIDLHAGHTSYEVKTDQRAVDTGNAFIETLSNVGSGRRGWAWTCQADWLLYFATPDLELGTLFWLLPSMIREQVPVWEREYRVRDAPNEGYVTRGVCVPLSVINRYCEKIEFLSTPTFLHRID